MLVLAFLAGCTCGSDAPTWSAIDPVYLGGEALEIDLAPYASDDKGVETFGVTYPDGVIAEVEGTLLTITPQPDFEGEVVLQLSATDACDNVGFTELSVLAEAPPTSPDAACTTTFTYTPVGAPDEVAIAGSFNEWDPSEDLLVDQGDGSYAIDLDLAPGAYTYKFVEVDRGAFDDQQGWSCDPNAELISCDPGYKEPWATDWAHSCSPGANSCNSLIVIEPCAQPTLSVDRVDVNVGAGSLRVEVSATSPSGAELVAGTALLDDEPVAGAFTGSGFVVDEAVSSGRHTLRFTVTDAEGFTSEEAYVPVWTDGADEDAGVLYFAFVDRLANGDTSIDVSEGATASGGGYEGGDVQGLIDLLPYLDDLGVTTLWLSNLQGNAEGDWAGDCGQTYAGYHAYWPDAAREPEEHFGDEQLIHDLVDEAHARGMRVIMDWVANHVHETHPYAADHPEWFNADGVCKESFDGQQNWDRIPESCAFAEYLPDIDYSQPDAMMTMLDDAMWWATTYELDGFRVDAVKHMPHAVTYNLQSLVKRTIEHQGSGSTTDFYTVGETFDSYDRIAAYIGDDQLDGQFDFDLYHAVRGAFLGQGSELGTLFDSYETSRAVYGDAPMSTFLGNHDVLRFISEGAEGWVDPCQDGQISHAPAPSDPWAYESLRLGWTFLFTMPGRPLVYYGDELGMPGRNDPDNRQPLWWHAGDGSGDFSAVSSVDDLAGTVDGNQAATLRHVAALANARAEHPALYSGSWTEWWREYDLFAAARSADGDHALVIYNRSFDARTLSNGVGFAGLPEGTYEDVLTGQTYATSGDNLVVDVPARGSAVLVYKP